MSQCLLLAYPDPYSELWSPGAALPPIILPYSHFGYAGPLYPLPTWPLSLLASLLPPLLSEGIEKKIKAKLVPFSGLCHQTNVLC